jgi:hypothetical protein
MGKPTQRFTMASVTDPDHFDISLRITIKGKYSTLREVIVKSRSYRQDSIENREAYKDVFGYHKPGISPSMQDGVAGMDLDELINFFRFKRNKRLKQFKLRLEDQEREKYVTYRFNKFLVRRITQLAGNDLDSFMVVYRPTYEFVSNADEVAMNQYILNASYEYKLHLPKSQILRKDP